MSAETEFTYDNRTGRGTGRLLRALGAASSGVARVRDQVEPFADAWREHNLSVLGDGRRRWIVLGDSMSQGVGASRPGAGWVGQLAARLEADGHELAVVNLSATGARTTDVLAQQLPLVSALPAQPVVAPPPLVTVLVGSNDLFGGRVARTALPGAFRDLVYALPRGSVVATLPQPRAAARLANLHVEQAAAAGHLHVVDMRTDGPRSWRGKLASDWFHPNDAGYAAIADAFEPAVRRVLTSPLGLT